MSVIFRDFTLKWWQGSLLKVSLFAFGIVVGARWPEAFRDWTIPLLIVFIVPACYLAYATLTRKI